MTRWVSGLSRLFADARYARKVLSTSDPTTAADSAAGYRIGDTWVNTATGNIWTAYDVTAGAAKWRHQPRVLGAGAATGMSVTGTLSETVLATVPVPAAALGVQGVLRATLLWGYTNSGNNKVLQLRLGASGNGIAGDIFGAATVTTTAALRQLVQVQNRNSQASQVTLSGIGTGGWGTTAAGIATATRDTSVATEVAITGALANSGETITLHSYLVELLRPDIT